MKKFGFFLVLVFSILLVPFIAHAEDELLISTDGKVNIYFFRGEGCSHCAEAEVWFESIQEEYGHMFNIVDYETWYNADNASLMQAVADLRGEDASGVPYIIIGNKSWNGFAESYTPEMLSAIISEYETEVDARYDIMKYVNTEAEEKKENNVISLIIIIVVAGLIGFGLYKARATANE